MVENRDVRRLSFDELLKQYERLLHKIAYQWRGILQWEEDDVMQELRLELWKAAKNYDPNRPPTPGRKGRRPQSFAGYLVFCCQNRCWRMRRDSMTAKAVYTTPDGERLLPVALSLFDENVGPAELDVAFDESEWLAGLSENACRLGEVILSGNLDPRSWGKEINLSREQMVDARDEIRQAVLAGAEEVACQ